VLGQTHPPASVVVVDDGSTDTSREIVERYPSVRLLSNTVKGANHARVMGLQATDSPLIAFLDQDDLWHPEHLAVLSELLADHPSAVAAVAGCGTWEGVPGPIGGDDGELIDPWVNFPSHGIMTPSAVLMRRHMLTQTGGWPTTFPGVADAVTWFKLGALGPLVRTHRPTLERRRHETSYSSVLRSHRLEHYLQSSLAGREHAVDFFASIHGAYAAEPYRKRLAAFREILVAFELTARGDIAAAQEHATQHGDLFAHLVDRERSALAGLAFWYLEAAMLRMAEGNLELALRARRCRSLSKLHGHLYQRLSTRSTFTDVLKHTFRHPPRLEELGYLLDVGRTRLSTRMRSWRAR
jgi:glycosyltransferase involved in cell wall biosynthesis